MISIKAKLMPIEEARTQGYLQEANRQFFHPLGLSLMFSERGSDYGRLWIIDHRDDIEGVAFNFENSELNTEKDLDEARAKCALVSEEKQKRISMRQGAIGAWIEQIPDEAPPMDEVKSCYQCKFSEGHDRGLFPRCPSKGMFNILVASDRLNGCKDFVRSEPKECDEQDK